MTTDLYDPGAARLDGMWRNVYRKAAGVALRSVRLLLDAHVHNLHRPVGVAIVLDRGGAVLATGSAVEFEMPAAARTLTAWSLVSKEVGSMVIDVRKAATWADFPATAGDLAAGASICGGSKPTLSSARKAADQPVTGWDVDLEANCVLQLVNESVSGITRATLILHWQAA
jgi:hypothetical protein